MDAKTFSNGSNARRAADKMIGTGSAPAVDYGVRRIEHPGHSDDGRYEIVWKTTRQANDTTDGFPEETSEAAELAETDQSEPLTTDEVEAEITRATDEPAPGPAPAATEPETGEAAPQSAAEGDAAQPPASAAPAPIGGESERDPFPVGSQVQLRARTVGQVLESYGDGTWAVQLIVRAADVIRPGAREARTPKPASEQPRGKSAERDAAAARGVMPEKPVITSAANQHYQKRFDRLAELAGAGDWAAIAAYEVRGYNTYAKEVARYRDRLLAAHAASEKAA
jgi:hypothetical protein